MNSILDFAPVFRHPQCLSWIAAVARDIFLCDSLLLGGYSGLDLAGIYGIHIIVLNQVGKRSPMFTVLQDG